MASRLLLENGVDLLLLENGLDKLLLEGPDDPPAKAAWIQPWATYQREYVARQPQTYVAAQVPQPVVSAPPTQAWVQNWAAYSREYVQRQPQHPMSIFDLGNQGNKALPALPVQDWTKYTREYVQGKLRQEPRVPAPTLRPEFSRPFVTPWRVDLYPAQQPQDSFTTTLNAPPPPAPYIPPSNVRPLQVRTDYRIQRDTSGAQDYTAPVVTTFVPGPAQRPLQTRTDWRLQRWVDGAPKTGTSQPFVPSQIVRPLQVRQGWTLYDVADMGVPVQPINTAFFPYQDAPRDLQTRHGWTLYKDLGQAVFAQSIIQDPNAPVVLDEDVYEFWDIPPYPRQQPKIGIATTAPLVARSVAYTVSGGIIFGGTPSYVRSYKWAPAGGIVFSGNASYTPVSTGVVVPTFIYNRRIFTKLNGKR